MGRGGCLRTEMSVVILWYCRWSVSVHLVDGLGMRLCHREVIRDWNLCKVVKYEM